MQQLPLSRVRSSFSALEEAIEGHNCDRYDHQRYDNTAHYLPWGGGVLPGREREREGGERGGVQEGNDGGSD